MSVILPGFSVQLLVSLSAPIQSFPHFDGGGLVQVLVRVWCPSPHVLLHDENFDHGVYWPSIGAIMVVKNKDNRVGSLRKRVFLFTIKQYTRFSKKRFKCDTKGRNDPRRRTTFRQSKKKSEKFSFDEILVRASQQHRLDAWHYTQRHTLGGLWATEILVGSSTCKWNFSAKMNLADAVYEIIEEMNEIYFFWMAIKLLMGK